MPQPSPLEKDLKYLPPPERPANFDRELKKLVGLSPNQNDPYLRFVWGMDATEILDGYVSHRYPDPNGVYVGVDRWVLEGWQSPDVYDRKIWESDPDLFGPWPENGIWDFIETLQDEQGGYLPLSSAKALRMVRDWRHWKTKPKPRALKDLLEQRCRRQVLREKRAEEARQKVLGNLERDVSNILQGDYDPRRKERVATIDWKGELTHQQPPQVPGFKPTDSGLLVPNN